MSLVRVIGGHRVQTEIEKIMENGNRMDLKIVIEPFS